MNLTRRSWASRSLDILPHSAGAVGLAMLSCRRSMAALNSPCRHAVYHSPVFLPSVPRPDFPVFLPVFLSVVSRCRSRKPQRSLCCMHGFLCPLAVLANGFLCLSSELFALSQQLRQSPAVRKISVRFSRAEMVTSCNV